MEDEYLDFAKGMRLRYELAKIKQARSSPQKNAKLKVNQAFLDFETAIRDSISEAEVRCTPVYCDSAHHRSIHCSSYNIHKYARHITFIESRHK